MVSEEYRQQIANLRRKFRERLSADLAGLDRWMGTASPVKSPDALRDLREMAHRLAGSGATFGFADISRTARALECRLDELLAGNRSLGGDDPELASLIAELRSSIDTGSKGS